LIWKEDSIVPAENLLFTEEQLRERRKKQTRVAIFSAYTDDKSKTPANALAKPNNMDG
jgi:hypothetical protein